MHFVILQKAKPYTRVRRGKFEHVKGYMEKTVSVLKSIIKEFDGLSPKDIDSGWCGEFALIAMRKLPGSEAYWTEDEGHFWIKYKDKFYDAQHLRGETNLKKFLENKKWKIDFGEIRSTSDPKVLHSVWYG